MTGALSAGIGALAKDDLPPFHVPLRFFATAPLFLATAGLVWLCDGETWFASRWSAGMLAATHLLTLGFFAMVMLGALFQVVPVLGGGRLPWPRTVATIAHLGLAAGTAALAYGFLHSRPGYLQLALVLLAIAFVTFVGSAATCLLRRRSAALLPVRLAGLAFLATIGLGGALAAGIAWPQFGFVYRLWTDVHAAWGGLGFGLLLVIGVGQQVVPMFHVTPAYGAWSARWPKWLVFLGLVLLPFGSEWSLGGAAAIALGALWHVAATLWLVHRRRRRRADATVLAWQIGLSAVAAALLLAQAETWLPPRWCPLRCVGEPRLLLGILFGLLGIGTIVVGMLTKIAPFLAFLHLQRQALPSLAATRHIPPMADLLSTGAAFALVGLHVAAAVAAVWATWSPHMSSWAGGLLMAEGIALAAVLALAALRYRRAARAIAAAHAAA